MRCADAWDVRCPKCGNEYSIEVQITTYARFTSGGTDVTESFNADHEWESASQATCLGCGHSGIAGEFAIPLED